MRVSRKILLVGGVPTLIATVIALSAYLMLGQEERARAGAVQAGRVHRALDLVRAAGDERVTDRPESREAHVERFQGHVRAASTGLETLNGFVRTAEQGTRIAAAQGALARYGERMRGLARVVRENDANGVAMAARAEALVELAGRIRVRQRAAPRAQPDEAARLMAETAEVGEAAEGLSIATVRLAQRTADALAQRDAAAARAMLAAGAELATRAAALPASLGQTGMADAVDGWRERLMVAIGGLERQAEALAAADAPGEFLAASAQSLDDAFTDDADRFGAFMRQILLAGAAAGVLAGAVAALAAARAVLTPLRRLRRDLNALAAAPEGGQVRGLLRDDAFGDIARAANLLVTEIARRAQAERQAGEQAEAALAALRRAQDALIRADRRASLGGLVPGIAGEIATALGLARARAAALRDEARGLRAALELAPVARTRLDQFLDRSEEGAARVCADLSHAVGQVQGFGQAAADQLSDAPRRFRLDDWLDDQIASLQPLLRRGGHTLVRACPPVSVETHPGALAQVVANLVTNAVEHGFAPGRAGRIVVRVQETEGGTIRMEVADDGVGIAAENLARIFEPFFTTAQGSTGLGMHIVHDLVTGRLGGEVAVASRPGEGTRVRIHLPVRAESEGRIAAAQAV